MGRDEMEMQMEMQKWCEKIDRTRTKRCRVVRA
jgi:hypothetical protein